MREGCPTVFGVVSIISTSLIPADAIEGDEARGLKTASTEAIAEGWKLKR